MDSEKKIIDILNFPGVRPRTVENGKPYYKYFNESHLNRNLMFAPDDQIKCKTSLACFARTGSNWLKFMLEEITGFYLADDHFAKGQTSILWLISQGELLGIGKNSFLVKTHYPFVPNQRTDETYTTNRVIIQIRNPIDCIVSLFNLVVVDHHVDKISEDLYLSDPVYDKIFKIYLARWIELIKFWEKSNLPYVYVRYEDLTTNLSETLKFTLSFIQGKDVKGSFLEKKIDEYVKNHGSKSFYKDGPQNHKNLYEKHQRAQIQYIYDHAKEYLSLFGYAAEYENFLGIEKNKRMPNRLPEAKSHNDAILKKLFKGEYSQNKLIMTDTSREVDVQYEELRPEMLKLKQKLIHQKKTKHPKI